MSSVQLSSQQFENRFCNKLQKLAIKQNIYESSDLMNYHNLTLKNEYNQFLNFCFKNKELLMSNDNLLSTVKALLRYNHRVVNNVDFWQKNFN